MFWFQDNVKLKPISFDKNINVFEWIAPINTPKELIQKWTSEVSKLKQEISKFELGGEPLREMIRDRKNTLINLRNELFSNLMEDGSPQK